MPRLGEVNRTSTTLEEFEWKIPNFVSFSEERYNSFLFSFAGTPWEFIIHPKGTEKHNSIGYISLFLARNKKKYPDPISPEVFFSLETLNCSRKFTQPIVNTNELEVYGDHHFLSRDRFLEEKLTLLPSKVLTVFCTLKHPASVEDASDVAISKCSYCNDIVDAKDISSHQKKCVDKPIKCPECSEVVALKNWYEHTCQTAKSEAESCESASSNVLLENKVLNDFKEFFLKHEDCDVTIKVQGQELQAHKAILQARSPVFASTFRNEMKEKATGVVNIDDCDPSSFSDFLCFLYCGEKAIISEANVCSLFTTADKYDVQDLRAQCVKFMKENLSVGTFCDTITLALRHSEKELINLTTDFFTKNAPKIILTVKWLSFLAENTTEGNELLVKLLVPSNSK